MLANLFVFFNNSFSTFDLSTIFDVLVIFLLCRLKYCFYGRMRAASKLSFILISMLTISCWMFLSIASVFVLFEDGAETIGSKWKVGVLMVGSFYYSE
jgi:hypothetical protein